MLSEYNQISVGYFFRVLSSPSKYATRSSGFYFDAEKNRYFPIKGPIPGSSRITSSSSSCSTTAHKSITETEHKQANKACKGLQRTTAKLLQSRELYGNIITSTKRKYNFWEEYQKIQVSEPMIWRYHGTDKIADCALEQVHVDMDMPDDAVRTEILLAGGLSGSFCLSEVVKDVQQFDYGVESMPDPVLLLNIKKKEGFAKSPGHLWRPNGASINMQSTISCIKMFRKHCPHPAESVSSKQITTLGSETSGGSVYILNLSDSLEFNSWLPSISRRMNKITLFNCTVWTADGNFDGSEAAIGTNLGAALVNIETGTPSWVFRCKSDVLSLQLDHSGNNALCGLRNGAIVTVDIRQKSEGHARLARQRIPHPSHKISESSSRSQNFNKQWFELKGNIYQSCTVSMPSSISCLASLKLYDQYFLASSMDGSIKL